MARRNASQWAKLVKEWKRSGETATEFGARVGVEAHSLHSWRWRLRKDGLLDDEHAAQTSAAPAFLPHVVSRDCGLVQGHDQHVDIVVDDRNTVRVLPGFDDTTLRRVLDVLQERAMR
ncbi:MAG: hypothetical protein IPM54_03360 [Polyangiaceae bacterium]|nr:hypothetical protein [Polyangiaceae bacterium]